MISFFRRIEHPGQVQVKNRIGYAAIPVLSLAELLSDSD